MSDLSAGEGRAIGADGGDLDGGDRPQPGDAAGREGAGLGAVSPMPGESGPMGNGEGCTPSDLHQVVAMP